MAVIFQNLRTMPEGRHPSSDVPCYRPSWISALICLVLGMFLGGALLVYNPVQSTFHAVVPSLQNPFGRIGADTIWTLLYTIGVSTWLVPVFAFWMLYVSVRNSKHLTGTRVIAMVFACISLAASLAMLTEPGWGSDYFPRGYAGLVGVTLYHNLFGEALGPLVSGALLFVIFGSSLLFIFTKDMGSEIEKMLTNFNAWRAERAKLNAIHGEQRQQARETNPAGPKVVAAAGTTGGSDFPTPVGPTGGKTFVAKTDDDPLALSIATVPRQAAPARASADTRSATTLTQAANVTSDFQVNIVKPEEPNKTKSAEERALAAFHEQLVPFLPMIIKHLPTLRVRRSQLVTSDHYGNAVTTAWDAEIDYFVVRNLLHDKADLLEDMKTSQGPPYTGARYFRLKYVIESIVQNAGLILPKAAKEDVNWSDLDPLEFERRCCESLMAAGWQARITQGSGDQGIDIIATHDDQKLVVQCKRYLGTVGNKAVQEIVAGRTFERADLAAVVSTGTFTRSARQLAAASDVTLLHPSQICATYRQTPIVETPEDVLMDTDRLIQTILTEMVRSEARALNSVRQRSSGIDGFADSSFDGTESFDDDLGDDEELYQQALDVLRSTKRASTSMLQRRLRIGYSRAARIMEIMEEKGIVGPENGSSPREILADLERL